MKTILRLIERHGGLDALKATPIRIPPRGAYMRLTIEYIGKGPRGWPAVSVAHYYEQNGDLCQDPEMTFEVVDSKMYPLTFQQAIPPIHNTAVWKAEDGRVMIHPGMGRELLAFSHLWDRNLRDQGYLD